MHTNGPGLEVGDFTTEGVGQTYFSAGYLIITGITPELPDNLGYLRDTGSAEGMALGEESTAGIHREPATEAGNPIHEQAHLFPSPAETQLDVMH